VAAFDHRWRVPHRVSTPGRGFAGSAARSLDLRGHGGHLVPRWPPAAQWDRTSRRHRFRTWVVTGDPPCPRRTLCARVPRPERSPDGWCCDEARLPGGVRRSTSLLRTEPVV